MGPRLPVQGRTQNAQEIRGEYGNLVFAIEIRVNTRLAETPAEGKIIFEYDVQAAGAKAYQLLVGEFLLRARHGVPV